MQRQGAVRCELEGDADAVAAAVDAIRTRPPPMAHIDAILLTTLPRSIPHRDSTSWPEPRPVPPATRPP